MEEYIHEFYAAALKSSWSLPDWLPHNSCIASSFSFFLFIPFHLFNYLLPRPSGCAKGNPNFQFGAKLHFDMPHIIHFQFQLARERERASRRERVDNWEGNGLLSMCCQMESIIHWLSSLLNAFHSISLLPCCLSFSRLIVYSKDKSGEA